MYKYVYNTIYSNFEVLANFEAPIEIIRCTIRRGRASASKVHRPLAPPQCSCPYKYYCQLPNVTDRKNF